MEKTQAVPLHLAHDVRSPMAALVSTAHRVGAARMHALVYGEGGTGKESLARVIHAAGAMTDSPFRVVRCGGRKDDELAREILDAARCGTLFLEDIEHLPPALQQRLRDLIDAPAAGAGVVRIVGSSRCDLLPAVGAGRFRRDLYDALACKLQVLPLRERRDDVLVVMDRCWETLGAGKKLASGARELLTQYAWPGNAREAASFARQIVAACPHAIVSSRDVERVMFTAVTGMTLSSDDPEPSAVTEVTDRPGSAVTNIVVAATEAFAGTDRVDLPALLRRIEGELIEWALAQSSGQRAAAAQMLGIGRTTLVEKIRRGVAHGSAAPPFGTAALAIVS
jgi:sigma-54 specific flagellar transcriptional regulator A